MSKIFINHWKNKLCALVLICACALTKIINMTRREFLKKCCGLVLGGIALYVSRTFGFLKKSSGNTTPKRLAKYYRQSDDLAG